MELVMTWLWDWAYGYDIHHGEYWYYLLHSDN